MTETPHRSGTVALIGRPNAGKSTLLNQVLGQKLSIVSNKPQTTRNRVVGIHTRPGLQAVLVDTPGIHEAKGRLNRSMVRVATSALTDVDSVCWVIDAERAVQAAKAGKSVVHAGIEAIGSLVTDHVEPAVTVLALNKIDLVERLWLLPVIDALSQRFVGTHLVPVSARKGDGIDRIDALWGEILPEGPAIYPEDQLTDASERFVVAELIREKVFRLTNQEIPYATAVEVEQFAEDEESAGPRGRVLIHARIFVARDSQKGIIIGKGGQMLTQIGTAARKDIERLLGARVHLELHVAVQSNWPENPRVLRELGIE